MGIDDKIIEEIVRQILTVAKPDKIILFGSAATGQMTRDSDVDLLIVEPDPSEADAPLPALVQPVPTPEPDPVSATTSPRTRKRELREKNSECVRSLVHRTQLGHANINAELNQRVGIRRITEATADQLQRRLVAAQKWLKKL